MDISFIAVHPVQREIQDVFSLEARGKPCSVKSENVPLQELQNCQIFHSNNGKILKKVGLLSLKCCLS